MPIDLDERPPGAVVSLEKPQAIPLRLLVHPTRIQILQILYHEPSGIYLLELHRRANIGLSLLYHHLDPLLKSNLVVEQPLFQRRVSDPRRLLHLSPKGFDFLELVKQLQTRLSLKEDWEDP